MRGSTSSEVLSVIVQQIHPLSSLEKRKRAPSSEPDNSFNPPSRDFTKRSPSVDEVTTDGSLLRNFLTDASTNSNKRPKRSHDAKEKGDLATCTVHDFVHVSRLPPFRSIRQPSPFVQPPITFINHFHSHGPHNPLHTTTPSTQPLIHSDSSALNSHHHNEAAPIGTVEGSYVSEENIYHVQPRPQPPGIPIAPTFPTDSPLHSPSTPMNLVCPIPPNEIATTSTFSTDSTTPRNPDHPLPSDNPLVPSNGTQVPLRNNVAIDDSRFWMGMSTDSNEWTGKPQGLEGDGNLATSAVYVTPTRFSWSSPFVAPPLSLINRLQKSRGSLHPTISPSEASREFVEILPPEELVSKSDHHGEAAPIGTTKEAAGSVPQKNTTPLSLSQQSQLF